MSHVMLSGKANSAAARNVNANATAPALNLRIGEPNDAFEQEADRAAEDVMSAKMATNWQFSKVGINPQVQRKCAGSGECECSDCATRNSQEQFSLRVSDLADGTPIISQVPTSIQRQKKESALEDEPTEEPGKDDLIADESGRPKRIAGEATTHGLVPWTRPPGLGSPMPTLVRHFMESRFSHDFGKVRIHDGAEASHSASRLHAHAYTVGNDIYFNWGEYHPELRAGAQLLAHELAHVVQQSNGSARQWIQRKKKGGATCGPKNCDGNCAPPTSGHIHNPICGNESCPTSGPSSSSNFIRHLDVNLSTQMIEAEMGDAKHPTGLIGPFLSSPNPSITPTTPAPHVVGIKCGACHTNQHGDGMGWFTSFANGLEFGFHNSQRVARGVKSHGCVRVPCDRAHWIHDNASSGVTTVCVHTGGKKGGSGWGCGHARPILGGSGGSGTSPAPEKSTERPVSDVTAPNATGERNEVA
jgi:hypothetical protein